jgi:hypothetical protein
MEGRAATINNVLREVVTTFTPVGVNGALITQPEETQPDIALSQVVIH